MELIAEHLTAGWNLIPIPAGKKGAPLLQGVTGIGKHFLEEEEIMDFAGQGLNFALSLTAEVIGLDFDLYKNAETLVRLSESLGSLPLSVLLSSHSKPLEDGFTAFFRVPVGVSLVASMGALDIIKAEHRYSITAGSIHPSGREYRWTDLAGNTLPWVPEVEGLPELPSAWLEALKRPEYAELPETLVEPSESLTGGSTVCKSMGKVQRLQSARLKQARGRHDAFAGAIWALAKLRAEGHSGFEASLALLKEEWLGLFSEEEKKKRGVKREAAGIISSALAKNPKARNSCACSSGSFNSPRFRSSFTTAGLF